MTQNFQFVKTRDSKSESIEMELKVVTLQFIVSNNRSDQLCIVCLLGGVRKCGVPCLIGKERIQFRC